MLEKRQTKNYMMTSVLSSVCSNYFQIKIIMHSKFRFVLEIPWVHYIKLTLIQYWWQNQNKLGMHYCNFPIFINKHWLRIQALRMKLTSLALKLPENKNTWTQEESIICSECISICCESIQKKYFILLILSTSLLHKCQLPSYS